MRARSSPRSQLGERGLRRRRARDGSRCRRGRARSSRRRGRASGGAWRAPPPGPGPSRSRCRRRARWRSRSGSRRHASARRGRRSGAAPRRRTARASGRGAWDRSWARTRTRSSTPRRGSRASPGARPATTVAVEAFDHAAHGDRSRHGGRLPVGLPGELSMSEMPDVLRLHADGVARRAAVIVDAAGGARPSATTFAELNAAREPARARSGRARARSAGDRLVWCGPNSLEVIVDDPRGPEGRPGRGAAVVPVHRRGDAVRHRQLRRDARGRRRRAGAARRRGPRPAARRSGTVVVFGGDVARRAARRGTTSLRRRSPTTSPAAARTTSRRRRRADDLHVGHHREAQGRAAHHDRPRRSCFALLGELGLRFGDEVHLTTGPLYHSGPLAFASLAHTLGGADRGAAQVRRRPRGCASSRSTGSPTRSPRPTQLKRIVSLPAGRARSAPTCRRCAAWSRTPRPCRTRSSRRSSRSSATGSSSRSTARPSSASSRC